MWYTRYDYLIYISDWNTPIIFLLTLLRLYCSYIFCSYLIIYIMNFFLVVFFVRNHSVLFYISYEIILIPILILILIEGSEPERLNRLFYIVLYTAIGSLPLLFSGIRLIILYRSISLSILLFSKNFSILIALLLIMTFLVKLPIWGVHRWLPLAHVYSPVAGRVLLAGILLKVGAYGLHLVYFIRVHLDHWLFWVISSLAIWGAGACFFSGIRQSDFKSVIAYSSVIHIGLVLILVREGSYRSELCIKGLLFRHGIVRPILFRIVDCLAVSSGTRSINYISRLSRWLMPLSVCSFIAFCLNIGLPPSINFFAEILGAICSFSYAPIFLIVFSMVFVLRGIYNIVIWSRLYKNKHSLVLKGVPPHIDTIIVFTAVVSIRLTSFF